MKNITINGFKLFILFLILGLALLVRKRNYAEIPIPGQSLDEYSYSWLGLSLLETGMPVASSGIEGNKNTIFRYVNVDRFFQTVSSGDPITINYPWMDHPPLLGLITGGYAYLTGVRVFEDTTAYIIRKPIIIISTISVGLLMIYCWLNFGYLTAVVGGLFYATIPLVVLSGRMIQAENAIIPCLLACMISMSLYLKGKNDYWLLMSALIAGIATLFKLTGFVCHLFVLFALLDKYRSINKQFLKDFGFFLLISLPISFLFVIYGAVYGIENFKNILFSNYNRFYGIGPNSLIELIRNQRLTQHKFLPEVSIVSWWLVFMGMIIKKQKNIGINLVIWGLFSYLITYIFFGSQPYGWYTFPFWALLTIILVKFLTDWITKGKNSIAVFFILLTILGFNISRIIGIFEFQPYANWWRFGASGIFFILVLRNIINCKNKLIIEIVFFIMVAAIIYTNIKYLNSINLDYWWQNIS